MISGMKIILATPIYPPEIGGPATYTKELVGKLQDKHDITVVAFTNNQEGIPGSKLVAIDKQKKMIARLWQFFWAIYREAKQADVLYVQNAMAAGLPTILAGKLRGKPVILKFVGDEAWERATQHKKTTKLLREFHAHPDGGLKISLMRFLQGWVLRQATIVTTPSQYLGESITKAYKLDPKNVTTNYNAAEQITEAPFTVNKKPHQLVATARLTKWKGIDGIIEAVAILKNDYPDVSLIVHGDGPEKQALEDLAKIKNVSDRVTFTGTVSRTETWHTRKESAVYVLNSTYEGLPHTALTSFGAKIPIVATDIPGTNEAVYHEKSGLLIPVNDPKTLATAIDRLFKNEDLGKRLVAGGTDILNTKFSWKSHLGTLESFFQTVVSEPSN